MKKGLPTQRQSRQSRGAYTNITELIQLRHGSKELPPLQINKSQNPLAGMLTSNFKGRGIDFAEVRQYQPGDDVRSIDWRVTARTQLPHTKLFQEERERPVMILVDQSQSMFFGSKVRFKSVLAAEIAATLGWSCLNHGDRVGGMVFNDDQHREIRPKRNKHSLLRLLYELNDFNHKLNKEIHAPTSNCLADALLNIRRIAKHGFTVIIVSDFTKLNEQAEQHLRQLGQHNDILGIMVSDPMEHDLPSPDLYPITNGAQRIEINTAQRQNRAAYTEAHDHHIARVVEQFARLKANMLHLKTNDDTVTELAAALGLSRRRT